MTERVSLGQAHDALQTRYGLATPEKRFTNLINRYVSDPSARQVIGQTIVSELLYDPSQLPLFAGTYQTRMHELDPRRQKDAKALKSLDQSIKDQFPLQIRAHFDELVGSPERLGVLIDMNMDAAAATATRTEHELIRAASTDPNIRANYYANFMLMSLFEQVAWFDGAKSQRATEPTTLPQMKQVQRKMVDMMYGFSLHAARHPDKMEAHTFVWSVTSAHISHMSDIRSPAQGLLHTALYSDDPEIVTKALFIELVTHLIDQYQGRNDFVSRQMAIRENHPTAVRFIRAMQDLDPLAITAGDALADGIRARLVQTNRLPADDASYLDPAVPPLESKVLKYDPHIWYDFLHFYSAFSQAKSIPVTFPNGVFRGIGHESGGNEERAARLMATAWTTPQPEPVASHLAVEDAFRFLPPPSSDGEDASPIVATVRLNRHAGDVITAGAIPLDLKIGAHRLNLQIGTDGGMYFQDGEPVTVDNDNGRAWAQQIITAARPSFYRFLEKNESSLPAELIPQLARFMMPDLHRESFIQVNQLLETIKSRLADPDRGLLSDGITAKIVKGQLPGDSPINRIHFDQTGSVATIYIGKTKLLAKIDLHAVPPQVVAINGYVLNRDHNEDVWLEYIILAPLKSIACADPAVPEEKDDSMLLEGTEELSRPEAIRQTREVIRKKTGHRYQLPVTNGRPAKYTEAQRQKVMRVENPLIGYPILDLEVYNRTRRDPGDPYAPYWDYAVYREETYQRHQTHHAVVTVPHAYDGVIPIIESEIVAPI